MPNAEQAAGAVRDGKVAIFDLHLRMSFSPQLPHRFDDFCHAAAIDGLVAAQSPAVGVERLFADARNQIAVGDEFAALALFAKAEVFELHQDRDGEAVVDRGVFDVFRRHACFLERLRS